MAAKPRPSECFDAVLRAMTADRSITMKEALRRLNDGCGYSAFKEWLRLNPDHKARIDALRAAPPSQVHFEAIAALIRGGMSPKDACASRSEYPKSDTFLAWVRHRPDLYAALKPFIDANDRARMRRQKHRLGDRKYTAAELDAALAAIRTSDASDLRTVLAPPLPGYGVLQVYAQRDPVFAARFREAVDARPSPNRCRPEDIERALAAIRDNPDKPIVAVLGPKNNLPSYPTLQKLALTDREFAERLDAVVTGKFAEQGKRPKGRKIAPEAYARAIEALRTGRYKSAATFLRSDPTLPTLSGLAAYAQKHNDLLAQYKGIMGERRPKAAPKPTYTDYNFKRQLYANDVYRNALALLRVTAAEHREDVLQDIIVKMLERKSEDEIRKNHGQIVRDHFARTRSAGFASLDDEVFEDETGSRRVDLMTASEVHIW